MISLLDKQSKAIIIRRARFCAGAGIGRQAWLRAMCRKAWRFKSSPAHHHHDAVRNPRRFGDLCFAKLDPKGFLGNQTRNLTMVSYEYSPVISREKTFRVSY